MKTLKEIKEEMFNESITTYQADLVDRFIPMTKTMLDRYTDQIAKATKEAIVPEHEKCEDCGKIIDCQDFDETIAECKKCGGYCMDIGQAGINECIDQCNNNYNKFIKK